MDNQKKMIIAIDGFSSCGKSTFAKAIARKLGYLYVDSGAMYRAVTLVFIQQNAFAGDEVKPGFADQVLKPLTIEFRKNTENLYETYLNGENVEDMIRGIDVSEKVSIVSKLAPVRAKLVELQRKIGANGGIVMDGRDIGTVVFPDADIKIFMTAGVDIRTMRRYKELLEKKQEVPLEKIKENIRTRDEIDQAREISPLKKATDAVILDNSQMTPEEQLDWFEGLLKTKHLQE